jgi:tRNA A-37 threonylcarbamoyl transferase component Bud32
MTSEIRRYVADNLRQFRITAPTRDVKVRAAVVRRPIFHSKLKPSVEITIEHKNVNLQPLRSRVFAKRQRDPKLSFERLQQLYDFFVDADIDLRVPRPYCYDLESKFLFMEMVEGTSLRRLTFWNVLKTPWPVFCRMVDLHFAMGRWLGNYHRVMGTGEHVLLSRIIENVSVQLEKSSYLTVQQIPYFMGHLEDIINAFGNSIEIPLASVHGDFAMRNILATNDSNFFILDWDAMADGSLSKPSPAWYDVAVFLLRTTSLVRFSPLVSRSRLNALQSAFLRGYLTETRSESEIYALRILWVFVTKTFLIGPPTPMCKKYTDGLKRRYFKMVIDHLKNGSMDLFIGSNKADDATGA